MDLYNEKINEFVDWQTGYNTLTNKYETGGLQVSGKSIRELIQEKLRTPIFAKEDITDNMVRLFSSEEAYNIWNTPEGKDLYGDDLILFLFARPSQYKILLEGLLNGEQRYIIQGDENLNYTKLNYVWQVKLGDDPVEDSLSVTYQIQNSTYAQPRKFTEIYDNPTVPVSVNLYKYLEIGENTITVTMRGQNTGASSTVIFIMTVVQLNIESQFAFYQSQMDSIVVPYTLNRNDYSENVNVYVYIDGQQAAFDTIYAGLRNPNNQIVINNAPVNGQRPYISSFISSNDSDKRIVHNMQIWAQTSYNGVLFNSNLLYYDFVVKSDVSIKNNLITVAKSFTSSQMSTVPLANLSLFGVQFQPTTISFGYYTDQEQTDTSVSVAWSLKKDQTTIPLSVINGNKNRKSSDLTFIPTIYSTEDSPIYLEAYINGKLAKQIPVYITQSALDVYETDGAVLQLSAYGKTNTSSDKNVWLTSGLQEDVTFSNGIRWDDNSGWYQNSLRISGTDSQATIDYNAFSGDPSQNGRTIEIEFESEKVSSNDDVIIRIGGENGSRIEITPNEASLYDSNGNRRIRTNYKDNERIKIAFIINGQNTTTIDKGLIYIVTNGILERGTVGTGYDFQRSSGNIVIGGALSGVKFYSLRIYNRAISYTDEYNNYVFDSDNKAEIVAANNILDNSGNLDYSKCCNKLDTILISGDLSNILSQDTDKAKSETNVNISRVCPSDTTKNFTVTGCRIRKHGQSTLYYPITSMKFWLNKSATETTPTFVCESLAPLKFSKNRYKMKDTSIPANKFVLQANYADSSGVHNGGLLRLIQSTWYNANIDGEYKLRTIPQLFSSNQKVTYNDRIDGVNDSGKQWGDYTNNSTFPYQIEVAPDSFPCVVFYLNTAADNKITYLGQYVFMEDKKSDFNYGERSIYMADPSDPFCLTQANKKNDTDGYKVWDNKDVLRIEVVNVNTPFVSYMSDSIGGIDFEDEVAASTQEQEDPATGEMVSVEVEKHYRWEEDFELIYPDPDDIEGNAIGDIKSDGTISTKDTTKFGSDSKFRKTVKPFVDWFRWLVGTYNNHNKFRAEASDHLDLYKLAAYYVFFMRFGLVDSVERNVQIKTYDGVHFHYEPWDMDIALGNRNTGGIAFDPPVDRDTRNPGDLTSYALSGRSSATSNWLWDALEAWPEWRDNIVKKVADALFNAGLTYDNCAKMFDDEYASKWSEILYNESGYFKYVTSGKGSETWLAWLLGARTTHRHWWLSTSMDYYDAKWGVGDYVNHYIQIRADHDEGVPGEIIVGATGQTFFSLANETGTLLTKEASKNNSASFDITNIGFTSRNNLIVYGANHIESLDLSSIADRFSTILLTGAYSDVLGASLKQFNLGTPITKVNDTTYTGKLNARSADSAVSITIADRTKNINAFSNLNTLNIRGQVSLTNSATFMYNLDSEIDDLASIQDIFAMGSGLQNIYSSYRGNKFNVLELPSTVNRVYMRNSSWNTIEFWDTTNFDSDSNTATFVKRVNNIPSTITQMELLGTTGSYECSKDLVMNWIHSIVEQRGENALSEYSLVMDDINWSSATCQNLLTFDDLALIAKLNGLADETDEELKQQKRRMLTGYVLLENTEENGLSSEKLNMIRTWFGDAVFTKSASGSGLVIDYNLDYALVSIGSPATLKDGQIYLKEGNKASLNVTRFLLRETNTTGEWYWRRFDSNGTPVDEAFTSFDGISIVQDEEGISYLVVNEGNGNARKIQVYTSVEGNIVPITVNIEPVSYPQTYTFGTDYINSAARKSFDAIALYKAGQNVEIYIEPDGDFDATIEDVIFTIASEDSLITDSINKSYKSISSNPTSLDDKLRYRNTTSYDHKYGVQLQVYRDLNESPQYYTLTATIVFNNSTLNTAVSVKLVAINDSAAILSSSTQSNLYKAVNDAYTLQYGESITNYYKTDLLAITNKLTFENYVGTQSLITLTGETIFAYLPNLKEVDMSNCNAIASYNGSTNLMDLSKMSSLEVLNLTNCTGLVEDIDVSNNKNITTVITTGTSLNVNFGEGSSVTAYVAGSPNSISINTPISLTPEGVTVASVENLGKLELVNIPNVKTFAMFNKIMNV